MARSGGFGGGVEWAGGRWRPDRVGLGVEWSGLVVGGGQISDVEQKGERDRCLENEFGFGWVENEVLGGDDLDGSTDELPVATMMVTLSLSL